MADPEKQPEQPKAVQQQKQVIANKVTGTVKWFNVKSGYGFINRNDTKEDVFVHQSAIIKNNPKKFVRSVGDGEVVEFDVVVGEKGNEAANVTGPNGEAVKGSPYAADRRGKFRPWYYSKRFLSRPRRPKNEDGEGKEAENGEKSENENQGNKPRRYARRRYPMALPPAYSIPRPYYLPRYKQQDGDGEGDEPNQRPHRKPFRPFMPKHSAYNSGRRPRNYDGQGQGGGGGGNGGNGGPRPRPGNRRFNPRNNVRGGNRASQSEGEAKAKQGAPPASNTTNESTA